MKHLPAILALAILLTVGLACSDAGEKPTTTNAASTSDGSAANKSNSTGGVAVESIKLTNADDDEVTAFKTTDTKHQADVKFTETNVGKVKGIFTAVNAGGQKNYQIMEKEIEVGTLMNTATFSLILEKGFPAGDYKLDVYAGDKLIKTQNYKVQ